MNILFYVGSLKLSKDKSNYGGTESTLKLLADKLGQLGHYVCIYGPNVKEYDHDFSHQFRLIKSIDKPR